MTHKIGNHKDARLFKIDHFPQDAPLAWSPLNGGQSGPIRHQTPRQSGPPLTWNDPRKRMAGLVVFAYSGCPGK
jgi:hypothetical protein